VNRLQNNWQFIAIIITILLVLGAQIRNYGAMENRISTNEINIKENRDDYKEFSSSLNALTVNVEKLNTLIEVYFEKRGIKK
jgi:hypothetical protein